MENSFLHFEFDLFRIIYADKITKHSVPHPIISPYSIGICLSYLSNLVQSDTARLEIKKALHYNSHDYSIFLSAIKEFESRVDHSTTSDVFKTANIIFTDIDTSNMSENQVGILPEIMNYSILDSTSSTINKAVKSKTSGRISKLVNPMTKPSHNSIVMSSISLFEGLWKQPFNSYFHHSFHGFDKRYSIPMLQMNSAEVLYTEDKTCFAISIPFLKYDFSFVAILPRKKSFKKFVKFLKEFNEKKFLQIMDSLQPKTMNVIIPKFKIETSSFDLMNYVHEFGINHKLVMPHNRNFSQFCQKCVFELNEFGTVPLTEVHNTESQNMSIICEKLKSDKTSFKRPFVYFLVKNNPKVVLLSGTFTKPTTEEYSD